MNYTKQYKTQKPFFITRIYPVIFILFLIILNIVFILPLFLVYPSYIFNDGGEKNFYNTELSTNYLSAYIDERNKATDLIFFSGNGMSLGGFDYISKILRQTDSNIIYPVYKGYGPSEGSSNEIEIMIQIHALVDFIKLRNKKVFIIGYSLGGAATLYFNKIHGSVDKIILVSTFYSLDIVIAAMFPSYLPIKYFITERYENYERIKFCNKYVAFVTGDWDEMINYENTINLNKIFTMTLKLPTNYNLWILHKYDHNDIMSIQNYELVGLIKNFFK